MSAPSLNTVTPIEREVARTARTELDRALETFLSQRTRLFRIAYRVTGDVSGAEDVVQEAWLRWQRSNRANIENPAAFLTTTTTRLAINVIQSARHRHETPAASPLVEFADTTHDPMMRVEETTAVEQTLRLLMSRLSRSELAAYVLRKGFDYPYGRIAALLKTSVANARQLVHRAQPRIESDWERVVDAEEHRCLVSAFLTATRTGELADLERMLVDLHPVPSTSAVARSLRRARPEHPALSSRAA